MEVLRGPWGVLGRSQDVLGGGLGGTQNRRGFLGGSWEGPGVVLGWFWCSGMVLGSVLGCPNVDISLTILMFQQCEVFLIFFADLETGFVLRLKDKMYVF